MIPLYPTVLSEIAAIATYLQDKDYVYEVIVKEPDEGTVLGTIVMRDDFYAFVPALHTFEPQTPLPWRGATING